MVEAILEGFVALLRLGAWLVFFVVAAVISPPIIGIWTRLDKSQPFWPVFWRRYRKILFEAFVAGP